MIQPWFEYTRLSQQYTHTYRVKELKWQSRETIYTRTGTLRPPFYLFGYNNVGLCAITLYNKTVDSAEQALSSFVVQLLLTSVRWLFRNGIYNKNKCNIFLYIYKFLI